MAMQVHQPGNERVAVEPDDFARVVAFQGLRRGLDRRDASVAHRDRVIVQDHMGFDGHHVRGADQGVDGFHGGGVGTKNPAGAGFSEGSEELTGGRP